MSKVFTIENGRIKEVEVGAGSGGTNFYNGEGLPSNSLGVDGEFYLDTDTTKVYLKVLGAWVLQGSLTPLPFDRNESTSIANESPSISALKMVYADTNATVKIADQTDLTKSSPIGLTTSSAILGAPITFVTYGPVSDPSFTFPIGRRLFLGSNGTITDVAPTTGNLVFIGQSLGIGKVFIRIDQAIIL